MTRRLCYFAYGSNMLTARLRERVASARPIGAGELRGHRLRWRKRSIDGSAKCDIERTDSASDTVWGVLFEIDERERGALDRAEGIGKGYEEAGVEIVTCDATVRAFAYVASDRDESLRPFDWYKAFVVAGAREHRLPTAYVDRLATVAADADPDSGRAADNERILRSA